MRKKLDPTAGRLGIAMRGARQACHLSIDEAAHLLRIMPNELVEYERGVAKIPIGVLNHAFFLGYKMMRVRVQESVYRRQRNIFRKIKEAINETPK